MEITEVRIKLMEDGGDRLKAFCSITFDDCFVVRDLKIIEGSSGPFVAMPSRKLTAHCPQCGCKNHLRSGYCNQCGSRMQEGRATKDDEGRAKLYADIAHPINSRCREMIQEKVIEAFDEELKLAKQPGYVSRYDDYDYDTHEPHFTTKPTGAADSRSEQRDSTRRIESPNTDQAGPPPPKQPRENAPKPKTAGGFGEGIL